MNIVVCMKQVPDTAEVRIDPKTNTLVREGVPSIINPYDAHAIEEAVRIKESQGGKVTVITMGPPQAKEALKKAISYGADEAILLSDRNFAGSDTLATSYILTQAIKKIDQNEKVDIIFCGKQAIDGDTAQVGPGIASRLGIPQVTYVMKVDQVNKDKRQLQAQRKLEDRREIVQAKLPVLLTVVKEVNTIRYAPLPNLLRAARYQVPTWNKDDLNADLEQIGLKGSPTTVSRIFPPPTRPGGEVFHAQGEGMEQVINDIVDRLVAEKITANS